MSTHSKTIDVVIVEDHPIYREALARAISGNPAMSVVGEATSGREAISMLGEINPQVCVLDLGLPDIDGIKVLERVVSEHLDTRVLVLSGAADSNLVYAVLEAGATGFELKTAGPVELVASIAAVARGETVLPSALLGGLAEQIRSHRDAPDPTPSKRELEILRQVAEGHSAAEIAETLNLAESTVKTHLSRIYDKLGVSERAAAVAQAMRHGWID